MEENKNVNENVENENVESTEMVVQDIFDGIIPGFLKLVLLFTIVWLVRKKTKPIVIIFLILLLAVAGSFFGVF